VARPGDRLALLLAQPPIVIPPVVDAVAIGLRPQSLRGTTGRIIARIVL
jgi:hypothetical protein